jgi:ABC-type sugar transport system ATPase subunit
MASSIRSSPTAPSWRSELTVLKVDSVAKAFGVTKALRDASLELKGGEVHAIVGENGSGKSTLVKLLAGVHRPDSGSIAINGAPYTPSAPVDALNAGIATVFQEVLTIEPRSVLENVFLGFAGVFSSAIPEDVKRTRAHEALSSLLGGTLPLDVPAIALSLSQRQACCIARALVRDPQVLILDEATSALDVATRDRLFTVLERLAMEGVAIVFISHRMDEVERLGDQVTVLRSGTTVGTLPGTHATPAKLIKLMTGDDTLVGEQAQRKTAARTPGPLLLSADGIALRPGAEAIDFALHEGEIVGLAGLEGHGQDLFLRGLRGEPLTAGKLAVGGRSVSSPSDAAEAGVEYVPRERRAEGLFLSKSIRENFGLPTLRKDGRHGFFKPDKTTARLKLYVEKLGIVMREPSDLIGSLSGGNQQKVVLARWLATNPKVLLLNDPTRGIDIGAKRDVYALLSDLAAQGLAIVMLSTEVDELVELTDRTLVFREYALSAEIPRSELSRTSIVAAFFDGKER